MSNINCHSEMTNFHRAEVTLSKTQQDDMRGRRDAGRVRLENGLTEADKPLPREVHSQGSYQMRTMVQDGDNDYDIDDGAYFLWEDLVDDDGEALSPLSARERICDALKWDGRLKYEAVVKNNCVRQYYPIGYHIDMPVYRIVKTKDDNGVSSEKYELASGDAWIESDARAVTSWFNGLVGELNAGESDGSQMRRITKLTKKFARRASWKEKTTSGICITKLVVDHFQESSDRDDVALLETWKSIDAALQASTVIHHPVLSTELSSVGDEEVSFFRDCLHDALETLSVLDTSGCTRDNARDAWDEVFDTEFFSEQPDNDGDKCAKEAGIGITSTRTARRNDDGARFGWLRRQ